MTLYAIHAQITTHNGNYAGGRQLPLFYLDSRVQGITSREHAQRIAADVINPLGTIATEDMHVSAYPVDAERESADLDYAQRLREASEIGRQHGANAAAWVIDGNTDVSTARKIVTGIDAGDPAVMDMFRAPDLSGEFSDSYSETKLALDLGVRDAGQCMSEDIDGMSDFANAYSEAASESFWHTIERDARYITDHADAGDDHASWCAGPMAHISPSDTNGATS